MIFTKTGNSLTVFVDGETVTISLTHSRIDEIKKAIREDDSETVLRLANTVTALNTALAGTKVRLENGTLVYDGGLLTDRFSQKVVDVLTRRVVELNNLDLPVQAWLNFVEKLLQNPSHNSREQLFDFLEDNNLPLTDDGDFLAYKGVRADWTDCHTGTVSNKIGEKPSMPREDVDANPGHACSKGFHAGSVQYATGFSQGHTVVVKINPKNAVSVPTAEHEKLRMCEYEVVAEHKAELTKPLYHDDVTEYDYDDYGDSDFMEGDQITFEYDDETRVAWVDEFLDDIDAVRVTLDPSDVKYNAFSENYRNFKIDKIKDFKVTA